MSFSPDTHIEKLHARQRVLEEEVEKLYGLIEASTTVISTLDLDKLLDHIMVIAKKVIGAEASSLMLVDIESGNLSYEVALGEKGGAIEGKIQLEKGKGIAGWVAQSGVPLLVPDVTKDDRFFKGVDKITGFQTRSILCVPMKVHEKLIGVLEAINPLKGDAFTQSDLEIFAAFSSLASIAIENARMTQQMVEKKAIERELAIARDIQQKFLVHEFPQTINFNAHAHTRSAREIGGDFYDFVEDPCEDIFVIVGDVCGRGIPASLYMIEVLSELRMQQGMGRSPVETIQRLNEGLVKKSTFGSFVTLISVRFIAASGYLYIVNAGHLPIIIANLHRKEIRIAKGASSPPLGIQSNIDVVEYQTQIYPGEYVFIFTDGLVEIQNDRGEEFGLKRLEENILSHSGLQSPRAIIENVFDELDVFCAGSIEQDDVTLIGVQYKQRTEEKTAF